MYGRRPSRFVRGMEGGGSERKIYYPSRRARSEAARRSRPDSSWGTQPESSHRAQPEPRSRFRRHETDSASCSAADRSASTAGKRFRPHSDSPRGAKKKEKRFRAHSSDHRTAVSKPAQEPASTDASAAPAAPQYRSEPVYAYYPVVPVYAPPPPPPYPYAFYDPYGDGMSDEELAELNAIEDYEDRHGRDFDHYRRSRAAETVAKKERPEVLPKNYLVDTDDDN
ncbi:MAG: hypothetical protein E7554_05155 [Ruminococcaceae bacterium]|nr:hypothetical protein [Oscillospiraceae bacterium]